MAPSIPPSFTLKKSQILSSLSQPVETYTDLSPKGSIDSAIVNLISDINSLDGLVTTSSCAGRISIFLEGARSIENDDDEGERTSTSTSTSVGGKGGGRWLFVSHERVSQQECLGMWETLGMKSAGESGGRGGSGCGDGGKLRRTSRRYVKFMFEPLILHIACATLQHARPLLATAMQSGFRESGLQSLKCLTDASSSPMVAIRTAGVGFSSIIGYLDDDERIVAMVDRTYLETMLEMGNDRFGENERRIQRLERGVGTMKSEQGGKEDWEDKDERARRKREEGLRKAREARVHEETTDDEELEFGTGLLDE